MRRVACLCFVVLVASGQAARALDNALANHPSPYLALHGADPVAWQEWGPAALAEARRTGKLLYVSVGYFACHWCHVMQRESYRNADIAAYLNRDFIPVKVDRELNPALDARLIEFAETTRGRSGWPLNVFITPEGYPVYAALYEPPAEFGALLRRVQELWRSDAAAVRRLAERAAQSEDRAVPIDAVHAARGVMAGALSLADSMHGGFGEQSKFPSVPQLEFLLARLSVRADAKLRDFLELTLDEMARNGLQDHLRGGFFRYTVDPGWKTPHFEKMLYDNALLARLYLRAGAVLARPAYTEVARHTLDFLLAEMRDGSGAFIASLSAIDERGVEGGYYLWRIEELDRRLTPAERAVFTEAYGLRDAPPFAAGYLPMPVVPDAELAERAGHGIDQVRRLREAAVRKLRNARDPGVLPRDVKRLAGWNGLALAALAEAAGTLDEPRYRDAAHALRAYLEKRLWDGVALHRAEINGRAYGSVALEDYAYVALGLHEWAKLSGDRGDYALARKVAEAGWAHYYTRAGWREGADSLLRVRETEIVLPDGPLPSPAAVLCAVSLELARALSDKGLRARATSAAGRGNARMAADPFWYASHVAVALAATATR